MSKRDKGLEALKKIATATASYPEAAYMRDLAREALAALESEETSMAREALTDEKAHQQLMRFYGVTTTDALIAAQEEHVARLQSKLPKTPSLYPTKVREG